MGHAIRTVKTWLLRGCALVRPQDSPGARRRTTVHAPPAPFAAASLLQPAGTGTQAAQVLSKAGYGWELRRIAPLTKLSMGALLSDSCLHV